MVVLSIPAVVAMQTNQTLRFLGETAPVNECAILWNIPLRKHYCVSKDFHTFTENMDEQKPLDWYTIHLEFSFFCPQMHHISLMKMSCCRVTKDSTILCAWFATLVDSCCVPRANYVSCTLVGNRIKDAPHCLSSQHATKTRKSCSPRLMTNTLPFVFLFMRSRVLFRYIYCTAQTYRRRKSHSETYRLRRERSFLMDTNTMVLFKKSQDPDVNNRAKLLWASITLR